MFTLEWTSFQEVSELQFSLFSEQIKSAIVSVLQKYEQDSRLSTTLSGLTLVVELECKDCSEHMLSEPRAFVIMH